MKRKIICQDKYEAQKLCSLIFNIDEKETFVTGILDVVENEVILSLRDHSAHSVFLKDDHEVEEFTDFIQSVIENEHKLKDVKVSENVVEVTKE